MLTPAPVAGSDVEALYAIVRGALALEGGFGGTVPPSRLSGEPLRRAVMANRLVPLMSPWAEQLHLSDEDAAWLATTHKRVTVRALRAATQAESMQRRLAEQGVHSLILKGPALSVRTTGGLAGRQFSDIDILVDIGQLSRAERVLQGSGVEHCGAAHDSPVRGPYHRWVRWTQNQMQYRPPGGIPVELHWRLFANHRLLPIDFEVLWDQRSTAVSGGVGFTTLGPVHELLFVGVHAAVHGFSRLHWLIDVVRLLRIASDDTWMEVADQAAVHGATRAMTLAVQCAHDLEPNHRHLPLRPRTLRRVEDLARLLRPADQTMIRSAESLGVKFGLNGDPRYIANQIARWAVPPESLASVKAPPPLAFVYLPLRQARLFVGRLRQRRKGMRR